MVKVILTVQVTATAWHMDKLRRDQERKILLGELPKEVATRYEGHPRKYNLALLPGFLSGHSAHHNFDHGCYPGHHEYYPCGAGLGSRRSEVINGDGRGAATDAYSVANPYNHIAFTMNQGFGLTGSVFSLPVSIDLEDLSGS